MTRTHKYEQVVKYEIYEQDYEGIKRSECMQIATLTYMYMNIYL